MKIKFRCEEPKKSIYRKYSNFSQKDFQSDLMLKIREGKKNYLEFKKNFVETLEKNAPKKTKICRGNHTSYMNKILRKAVLKCSQLGNKANKIHDPKYISKYKN